MPSLNLSREETLNEVLRTGSLGDRPSRPADFAKENKALGRLARVLGTHPDQILQELVDTVLELCGTGSAGISILDSETGGDPNLFRWRAVAGQYAGLANTTLPRNFSPCGVVIDSGQVQLMCDPQRCYPYVAGLAPPCHEVLLTPFFLNGEPVGTIWAVMHDPAERFDAEDARLLRSIATFASAAYKTLKALECLTEANRFKDNFVATVAHELRNPLGPIRSAAHVLAVGPFDDRVKETASVIKRQVAQMTRLVDDLLDVSRVRLGLLAINPIPVRLVEVVRMAVEASQLSAPPSSHRLCLQISNEDIRVTADPLRLRQVLENLINNAVKYSDPGSSVTITMRREGSSAVIEVSDEGIGIASDEIGSVFDLFAQGGQAGTKRSRGGLGIGLHLAQQIITAHNGSLQASSQGLGRGSTFTVRLVCI
jgi:signal transduction histidine kinase